MDHPHLTTDQLTAGLPGVAAAPRGEGVLDLIVGRPGEGERVVLDEGELSTEVGLVGDDWPNRPSRDLDYTAPDPRRMLTIMNSRAAALIGGPIERWPLFGDQLYIDLDIGDEHLPAGTRLAIGDTVVEITEKPHTGCAKFTQRFGLDAMRFVNSPDGSALRMRGANAQVLTGGTIRPGDRVTVLPADA